MEFICAFLLLMSFVSNREIYFLKYLPGTEKITKNGKYPIFTYINNYFEMKINIENFSFIYFLYIAQKYKKKPLYQFFY